MVDKKTLDKTIESKRPYTDAIEERNRRREKNQRKVVQETIYTTNPEMTVNIEQGISIEDSVKLSSELHPGDDIPSLLEAQRNPDKYFKKQK